MDDGLLVDEEENKRRRTGGASAFAPPQQIWRFAVVVLHCSSRCWTTADIVGTVLILNVFEIRFDTDSTDKIRGKKRRILFFSLSTIYSKYNSRSCSMFPARRQGSNSSYEQLVPYIRKWEAEERGRSAWHTLLAFRHFLLLRRLLVVLCLCYP